MDILTLKAADTGDATAVVYAGILHDNAELLAKGILEREVLDDARADLVNKSGTMPSVTHIDPEQFRRQFLTAGRAPQTAPASKPSANPVSRSVRSNARSPRFWAS